MIIIRKKQLKIFEALTMFEQQIVCHKLPKSFDCIKVMNDEQSCINKPRKIIQNLKRRMLHVELEEYEMKIQHFEYLYDQELTAFKSETYKTNSSYQLCHFNMLIHFVKTYIYHYTKKWIHQIRYKESCLHRKLLRHSHGQLSATRELINVYPQIIIDVPKVSLNSNQLDYLSRTG